MKKTISLPECHSILLNIATAFHNICVAHNIPYYMLGGPQLGAVRHRGMIPWDDDMDFGVPREYFEQLKQILSTELQSSYNVISIDNTDYQVVKYGDVNGDGTIDARDSLRILKYVNTV